jgi:divalent metal cation (Fe/Co/Zn/Cd) transporter
LDEHFYDELGGENNKIANTENGIYDTEEYSTRKAGMQFNVELHASVKANISIKYGHNLAH